MEKSLILKLTYQEHTIIKTQAAKRGLSMKELILNLVQIDAEKTK